MRTKLAGIVFSICLTTSVPADLWLQLNDTTLPINIYLYYIYMVIAVFPVILEMVETCRETTVGVCLNMGNPFTCRGT